MTLYNSISSSLPANTYVVMGSVGSVSYYVDLSLETKLNQQIVSDFINVVGKHGCVNIENYSIVDIFEANIVIPNETDVEVLTIDYSSLPLNNQNIITTFVDYIVSKI
jgi:hypothetical protein